MNTQPYPSYVDETGGLVECKAAPSSEIRVADYMWTATGKQTYTAGLLLRGAFRRFLEKQKFIHSEIRIEYRESKGWLDSDFLVKVTGPAVMVKGWLDATDDWVDEINDIGKK